MRPQRNRGAGQTIANPSGGRHGLPFRPTGSAGSGLSLGGNDGHVVSAELQEDIMESIELNGAVLDMDGVITQTAKVHARAWKEMFDDYLQQRGPQQDESQAPFDIDRDYRQYVDGIPRYDGVRSFLESRGIELPYGDKHDGADEETICGLGNRKNQIFQRLLQESGVDVYDDAVEQVGNWKRAGWKVAVISSSRNCEAVLKAANVLHLFDAKVDGNDADRLGIQGKPAPDVFLHAAMLIGAEPSQVVIVEDAIAGIEAGRRGHFGLVVGVARNRHDRDLRQAGADRVVHDLRELESIRRCPGGTESALTPIYALESTDWLADRVRGHRVALFLDYDGTLTPIVRRPEEATLTDNTRSLLKDLAARCTLAIVSGRDRQDVRDMVQLENLIYAGSHGFDIEGPGGLKLQHQEAKQALPDLDEAESKLQKYIAALPGAHVERKRFAVAVHYREVQGEDDVARVEQAVDVVRAEYPSLRKRGGKKIFELQPDVQWDKGRAVLWLTESLGLDHAEVVVIYVGDDVTDEDAFDALRSRDLGIGVRVAPAHSGTKAGYYVHDCAEVKQFLEALIAVL
jgi:alpha,alpha-trehalase